MIFSEPCASESAALNDSECAFPREFGFLPRGVIVGSIVDMA